MDLISWERSSLKDQVDCDGLAGSILIGMIACEVLMLF
jgi:hypothetical protein